MKPLKMSVKYIFLLIVIFWCGTELHGQPAGGGKKSEDDIQVAVYYFPNWGPVPTSEWRIIKSAKPMFEGHQQPKIPLWGHRNENLPEVMEQKIAAAADHA